MLSTAGAVPEGGEWAAEVKWDGIRAQLRIDGAWCVRSRPGRDCSDEFPELAALAETLRGCRVILDGELVHLAPDGAPDFTLLRRRLIASEGTAARLAQTIPATFVAFDLLHLDGRSTRTLPYAERRRLLAELLDDGPGWRVPEHFSEPAELAAVTREHGLEGIVSKRLDAPYSPGRRSRCWLKTKHRRRGTFTVTGYRREPGEPETLFLARDGRRAGSVQYGLSQDAREVLREALRDRSTGSARRGITNVEGIRVVVEFHGRDGGEVRDPVLRDVLA